MKLRIVEQNPNRRWLVYYVAEVDGVESSFLAASLIAREEGKITRFLPCPTGDWLSAGQPFDNLLQAIDAERKAMPCD